MTLHFRYKYCLLENLWIFLDDCYIIVKKIGNPIEFVALTFSRRIKFTVEWTGMNFHK